MRAHLDQPQVFLRVCRTNDVSVRLGGIYSASTAHRKGLLELGQRWVTAELPVSRWVSRFHVAAGQRHPG